MPFWRKAAVVAVSAFAAGSVAATLSQAPVANPPLQYDHAALKPKELLRIYKHDWPEIDLPRDLALFGNNILFLGTVTDPPRRSRYRIYTLPALRVVLEDQLDAAAASVTVDRQGGFWGYQLATRRLISLGASQPDTIDLDSPFGLFDPIFVDSIIVGLGRFDHGRFGLFRSSGELFAQRGPTPSGRPDVPVGVRQMLNTGDLAVAQDGLLAVALKYYPVIELYSKEGSFVRTIRGPYAFAPRFWVVDGDLGTDVTLRFAYKSVGIDSSRIWALFSGRTREQDSYTASYGRFIHSFTREGKELRVYRLGGYSTSIVVDQERGCLYSAEASPRPGLAVYQLPKELGFHSCEIGS